MQVMDLFRHKIFYACIFLSLFSCELEEIPDEISFEKTFGGTANDVGNSVQQTQDGGYIITGYTESTGQGGRDVYLIKTDANGEIVTTNSNITFEETFGGTANDVGNSVQQTLNGGYIITGYTESIEEAGRDVYLIKTFMNGNPESFPRSFGGTNDDEGLSVQQTQDQGYIITGTCWSPEGGADDVCLIKTDAYGTEVFKKYFGGPEHNEGKSVQQTQDEGYIITGASIGPEGADVYLIKTDANGNTVKTNDNIVFVKNFGEQFIDIGNAVQQTQDGGYIITGFSATTMLTSDLYLIKTDALGNIIFERHFGRLAGGKSVQQTHDEGYIIAGYTQSIGAGGSDVYLIKTDADGDMLFEKTFGGTADDEGYSVKQTQDGGYIITGYTESIGNGGKDVYLIKTNASGDVEQ